MSLTPALRETMRRREIAVFDYDDRAMFELEPANEAESEAGRVAEAFARAQRRLDKEIVWLEAAGVIAALLFAVFVVSSM